MKMHKPQKKRENFHKISLMVHSGGKKMYFFHISGQIYSLSLPL